MSVIGLVDPPYEGAHYGKAYRNVGITIDRESQIERISASQAKYRLASPKPTNKIAPVMTSNRDLLKSLSVRNASQQTVVSSPPASQGVPSIPGSSNTAILASLKAQSKIKNPSSMMPAPRGTSPQNIPHSASNQTPPGESSRTWILWLVGGLFILFVLFAR